MLWLIIYFAVITNISVYTIILGYRVVRERELDEITGRSTYAQHIHVVGKKAVKIGLALIASGVLNITLALAASIASFLSDYDYHVLIFFLNVSLFVAAYLYMYFQADYISDKKRK